MFAQYTILGLIFFPASKVWLLICQLTDALMLLVVVLFQKYLSFVYLKTCCRHAEGLWSIVSREAKPPPTPPHSPAVMGIPSHDIALHKVKPLRQTQTPLHRQTEELNCFNATFVI